MLIKILLIAAICLLVGTGFTNIYKNVFASNDLSVKNSVDKYYLQPKKGRMYCYNNKEERVKGLLEIDGKTYYFNEKDGGASFGWHTIDNKTYFFDPEEMGAAREKIYKDENGDVYFNESGVMQEGIFQSGKGRYFLALPKDNSKKAYITYGWYDDPKTGKRYYFDPKEHGKAHIGLYYGDKTATMYFKEDGSMAEGITKIDDDIYLFAKDTGHGDPKNAYMYEGWYNDPKTGKRYYFKEGKYGCDAGKAPKGWFTDDCAGTMYFNKKHGYMADGLTYIDEGRYLFLHNGYGENAYKYTGWYNDPKTGKRYFFDPDQNGKAYRGWYSKNQLGDMYFKEDGSMATGVYRIDGSPYVFRKIGENCYTKR